MSSSQEMTVTRSRVFPLSRRDLTGSSRMKPNSIRSSRSSSTTNCGMRGWLLSGRVGAATAAIAMTVAGETVCPARMVGAGTEATATTVAGVAVAFPAPDRVTAVIESDHPSPKSTARATVAGVGVAFGWTVTTGDGTAASATTVATETTTFVPPPPGPARISPEASGFHHHVLIDLCRRCGYPASPIDLG
jgi:hypothetical protein